jgi:alpha-tubulin suppressor-like RCC1 family protein
LLIRATGEESRYVSQRKTHLRPPRLLPLLLLLLSRAAVAQQPTPADTDSLKIMVVNGRAPTAASRALGAAALRMQLASELAHAGEKALVLSRTETCGLIKSVGQICDSTMRVKYVGSYAYLLHARLAMWVDVDSSADGVRITPYLLVAPHNLSSFEESWSERVVVASASNQNESVRKLAQILPTVLAELPLLQRCEKEWSVATLDSLLPDVRALLSRRPSSTLARLCIAKILDRENAPPDSILAVTSAILLVDRHNRAALSLSADVLDRAMKMDSANVFWRELGNPYYTVVDTSTGIIHFSLAEVPGNDGGLPRMGLSFRASRELSCLLTLVAEYRVHADTITLGPFRLPAGPVICAQAFGPATGGRSVALTPGRYVLRIVHSGIVDPYIIVVTDSTIATKPLRAPVVSRISDTLQWRVRPNSFSLSCGSQLDAPWLCADAVRAVLSTKGITPVAMPSSGHHPYSGQGGDYQNAPQHNFQYAHFEDYQRAVSSMFAVYDKMIGRQLGYTLSFTEWRGRDNANWLRRKLTPDSATPALNNAAPTSPLRIPEHPRVASLYHAIQLGMGADVSCALTTTSIVLCWGRNDAGQLGTGTVDTIAHPVPARIRLSFRVKQLAVGRDHACVLSNDSSAYCWGSNAFGQIGATTTKRCLGDSRAPAPCAPVAMRVAGNFHFASISAGAHSTCGVTTEHVAVCWGFIPTIDTDSLHPPRCGDTLSVETCARTPQVVARALFTWKGGTQPVRSSIAEAQTGAFRSCAMDDEHHLACWGFGASWSYTVGNTPMHEGDGVNALALGYRHACALDDSGMASCWGWRDLGALGAGDATPGREDERYAARYAGRRPVVGKLRYRELAAGWLHTCGITRATDSTTRTSSAASGELFCWGDNSHGQLGQSPTVTDTMTFALTDTSDIAHLSRRHGHATPERVDLPGEALHVSLGIDHSCAIVTSGSVYCWGRNLKGALGTSSAAEDDWHPRAIVEFGSNASKSIH